MTLCRLCRHLRVAKASQHVAAVYTFTLWLTCVLFSEPAGQSVAQSDGAPIVEALISLMEFCCEFERMNAAHLRGEGEARNLEQLSLEAKLPDVRKPAQREWARAPVKEGCTSFSCCFFYQSNAALRWYNSRIKYSTACTYTL